MDKNKLKSRLSSRRRHRVRRKLLAQSTVRLSVHATGKHIYVQLIDDCRGITIASASSCESAFSKRPSLGGNVLAAAEVGELIGKRAMALGVDSAIFDRGAKRFHGRVAAVAEAAKKVGLNL